MRRLPLFVSCFLLAACGSSDTTTRGADTATVADTPTPSTDATASDSDAAADASPDTGAVPATPDPLFEAVWWPVGDGTGLAALRDESPWFAERRWLVDEASSWFDHVVHDQPGARSIDSSRRGYFGVGSGAAFTFVGTAFPLNTMHEPLGPELQTGQEGWFSDQHTEVTVNGVRLSWAEEWIWRPRTGLMAVTRARHADSPVELITLTFAPPPDALADLRRSLLRVVIARNTGAEAVADVALQQVAFADAGAEAASLRQIRDGDTLEVTAPDGGWTRVDLPDREEAAALRSAPFALAPGEERATLVVFEFAEDGQRLGAAAEAIAARGWEAVLDDSRAWWRAWHEAGMQVRTPDPRVNDLLEGLKATIRGQITADGAGVQFSHYTSSWHRDVYPPVRALLAHGYPDDAAAMPTFLYRAATVRGSIGNAIPVDTPIPDELPVVDWRARVPFDQTRLKGEGPSFLVLMHTAIWRATGDPEPIAARWDYLMHALQGQHVSEDGLLPFSGDETFRPQYAYNTGESLTYVFEDHQWSAYSGFLFVRAAEELAAWAAHTGRAPEADAAWLAERAAFVRERTDARYWVEEAGRYASMIATADGAVGPIPSEDINTQPIYLGYHDRHHPRARVNVDGTIAAIGRDNGLLQTMRDTPDELYQLPIGRGLMTGMAPGYFLFNLADLHHPRAEQVFDALGAYVSPSGNYPEVGLFARPGQALCPIYDRKSTTGELWARWRLWEGAVNLDALVRYLIGVDVDLPAGRLAIAPHLPHDAPFVEATHIPAGSGRLDLRYERDGHARVVRLTVRAPLPDAIRAMTLRLAAPIGAAVAVTGAEAPAPIRRPLDDATEELELALPVGFTAAEVRLTLVE